MTLPATLEALKAAFPTVTVSEFRGDTRVVVSQAEIYDALEFLHDDRNFDFLTDITCVDYLAYRDAEHRFGLVYLVANIETNERLTVRCFLDEPNLSVPTVVQVWGGANWFEREVYDMFGIEFEGHPDLRRILLPDEFTAFPLRKDYPLQGRGERHNFPVLQRNMA
jgi:NADH-quinone oxidoreductase subunit C